MTSALTAVDSVVRLRSAASLRGTVVVPGDKSISHRAAIMNAMSEGIATIENYATGADFESTLGCLESLGVQVRRSGCDGDSPTVQIDASAGLVDPERPLDAGNSGTTMRLLAGALAGAPLFSVLTGDRSLSARPMDRVVDPLRRMGARIVGRAGGRLAPLAIEGSSLKGIDYAAPVASAQVKSCLLLAGVRALGTTTIRAPSTSRDHTERLLRAQGVDVTSEGVTVAVRGPASLGAVDVPVPGDFSSAAYWLALACIHPDAEITVREVGVNPGRTGLLDVLREMGGEVEILDQRTIAGEPRANIVARSSRLRGVTVSGDAVPRGIDELPLVAVLGMFAEGVTEIRGASELRVKESDRIAGLTRELTRLGALVNEYPDGLSVQPGAGFREATCETDGDHRLAMSLSVAGLAKGGVTLRDAACVRVSYPRFWAHAAALGGLVQASEPTGCP